MLTILLITAIAVVLLIAFWRKLSAAIRYQIHFINTINKIPGPTFIEMLSELYNFKFDTEQFTYQMEALFRRYAYKHDHGLVCFWFGYKPLIFITRAESAKVILESTKWIDKPDDYDIFKRLVGNGLLSASGETWFKARRMITPAFHFDILKKYIRVFNEQTKILLEKLDEYCDRNETFDILPFLRRYGLDAIAETAMGIPINAQNQCQNDQYYQALRSALNLMWARIRYPWFWFAPVRWLYGYDRKLNAYCNICRTVTSRIIEAKKKEWEAFDQQPSFEELSASGKKRMAFMDLLFSLREKYQLSDEDIRGQVDMFMAAGSDAVTAQTGFNLFALGHRPEIQEKVYEELKQVIGETGRDITDEDVRNLKYMHQCICETGRITPNVVIFGRKLTDDAIICGYEVPAGVTCAISPFAVMRDPKHYDNPEIYDPEHFAPDKVSARDPFAFIPFSAGIRNCMGFRFALLEMTITLAHILHRFRVVSMLSEQENRPIPEFSLKPSKGFPVRLERR